MAKNMICISCPMGCNLTVDDTDLSNIVVTGNTCPKGIIYAKDEIIAPKRMVTSSVRVNNAKIRMVSVKTSNSIAKNLIFDSLKLLKGKTVTAPVHIGDVIVKDICGSGVDFIATKEIEQI